MWWTRKKKTHTCTCSLVLQSRQIDFTLVRSDRRSLGVQVLRNGTVVVRAPHQVPHSTIEGFLKEKSDWLARHQQRLSALFQRALEYREGATHPWLGIEHVLRVSAGQRSRARLSERAIHISVPDPLNAEQVEGAMRAFYKRSALQVFESRTRDLFPPFAKRGYPFPSIRTRWMKSNFGSMNRKGVMTLNLTLLRKPLALIDYVILHELCHLVHMNHSHEFYQLLGGLLPDWPIHKAALHGARDQWRFS